MKHVALAAFAGALARVQSPCRPKPHPSRVSPTSPQRHRPRVLSITCAAAAAATITVHCSGVAAIVVGGGN